MAKQTKPQQFDPVIENIRKELDAKADNIRRELDAKAENVRKELDGKIENKISQQLFSWLFGILISLLIIIFGGIISYVIKINDAQNSINTRLTHVETKTESTVSINERFIRLETQVEAIKPK